MNTTGGLLVLISLGLTILVGISACNGLVSEIHEETNNTGITQQSGAVQAVINPIFSVMGYGVLIIGAMIAIHAFA